MPFGRRGHRALFPGGRKQGSSVKPYGDEAHKEKCYKNARWISQPVCDYIWDGRIAEILEELANGAEALKLKKLVTAGIEAWPGIPVWIRRRLFPGKAFSHRKRMHSADAIKPPERWRCCLSFPLTGRIATIMWMSRL